MVSNATVTVVRSDANDVYGDPAETPPTRTRLDGCAVAPRSSADVNDRGRQGVVVGLTLFAPYGADIRHTDQLDVDGVLYDVDGEPGSWSNPFTFHEPGIEVALKRAAG